MKKEWATGKMEHEIVDYIGKVMGLGGIWGSSPSEKTTITHAEAIRHGLRRTASPKPTLTKISG